MIATAGMNSDEPGAALDTIHPQLHIVNVIQNNQYTGGPKALITVAHNSGHFDFEGFWLAHG